MYGFFGDEQLYISDPRALQSIIVKDQDSFEETTTFIETNKVIFGEGLVATVGDHHKRQRKIVSPAFSVPQLRKLVPKLYDVAHRLSDAVGKEIEGSSEVLDMAQWMSRVALESVGQAVLGYSFDPLNSPSNNPYTKAIRELIPALFRVSLIRQFAPFISRIGSPAFRRKLVDITPNATVQKIKMMSDVMYDTAKDILRDKKDTFSRSKDAHEQTHDPKDIISILLGQNKGSTAEEQLSDEELIGQMTVLIFGAQDTTSSALSRILFMLATHPIVQDNVRHEIQQARSRESNTRLNDDNICYDQLLSLPWLDAVIKETLRLYPPVPFVRRTATETCNVPLSTPIKPSNPTQGQPRTALTIPKGTTLFVSIAAPNRSPSIWGPDALEWRPERWLSVQSPGSGHRDEMMRLPGIYSGMLTFLGGGRSCIGYKFAQIEMKVILATLLSRFSFSTTSDQIVWNLSQIISPSVQKTDINGCLFELQGMPLLVKHVVG